ncbi:MAG: helix-turn-helix domain-containing protein [Pseudomonadota bacterium]|nr:helix-turn-helix domain-containing protein [Pseudomonadota bacterium]
MHTSFLTLTEAAALLRLHPVTVRALAASGRIPACKIGRVWRFVEIDLLASTRAYYSRADAVGDKESSCRSTNVQIAATSGPRSTYQTDAAYAALLVPRNGKKHRNGSTTRAPAYGASIASANVLRTPGRKR